MKVWRYVITHDDGTAPHYGPPFTTLAICKPKIRKGAQPGDLLMAFAGREISSDPDRVVWAGIVREKLTFEQYWFDKRFQGKKPSATKWPDNIYMPGGAGLMQVPNRIHGAGNVARDCGGQFVLVMDPAWHLDSDLSSLPEQFFDLRLAANHRRGHRVTHIPSPVAVEMVTWLASRAERQPQVSVPRIACGPSNSRCNSVAHRGCS